MARPVGGGAILEVTIEQVMNSQILLNIFHYRLGTTPLTTVDGDDVAGILATAILGGAVQLPVNLRAVCPANWTWSHFRQQWIYPTRYTSVNYDAGSGAGDLAPANVPQNVALTGTKKAIEANRHGIGSWHFGGLVETDFQDGLISAAGQTKMELIGDAMSQVVDVSAVPNAIALTPIIFNRITPAASLNWAEYQIQTTTRVERRRTVGLGI